MSAITRRTRRHRSNEQRPDWKVPTDNRALDNATLLPACRKPPLTPVLYSDALDILGVPTPQCAARSEPPGSGGNAWGLFFGNRG